MGENTASIFATIKKMLGVSDSEFDVDILVAINSTLGKLAQLGVGPKTGLVISGETEVWTDLVADGDPRFSMVQLYVYHNAKLIFDPPTNSSVLTAMKETVRELECRIQYEESSGHKE